MARMEEVKQALYRAEREGMTTQRLFPCPCQAWLGLVCHPFLLPYTGAAEERQRSFKGAAEELRSNRWQGVA